MYLHILNSQLDESF